MIDSVDSSRSHGSDARSASAVEAVIVNFNGGAKVGRCLRALREQTLPPARVVVVDNGSTDGSLEELRRRTSEIHLIELGENRGLPIARNAGLAAVRSGLVLSLDCDVYLAPDALEKMVRSLLAKGTAIVCPRIVLLPDATQVQCDGAALHFLGTLALRHAYRPIAGLPERSAFVGACIGACMLLDRERLLEAGGFDELFFFYFEDQELCMRLCSRGQRVLCEPGAVALHDRGEGTPGLSFRGRGSYPRRRAYLSMRHRWLCILIHYRLRTLVLLLPALAAYELAVLTISCLRGWLPAWLESWWWLLRHAGTVRERRLRAQAARRVGDAQLLSGGPIPLAPGVVVSRPARAIVDVASACLDACWRVVRRGIDPK